jgi:hypothetical protein
LQIEHFRGRFEQGLRYGVLAQRHFEAGAASRESTPAEEYLAARFFFHIGALHAIHGHDHVKAIEWYDKAIPGMLQPTPSAMTASARQHGDALVSMGVSYWQADQRAKAVEVTRLGTDILQQAVDSGSADKAALEVPLGNLAAMESEGRRTKE